MLKGVDGNWKVKFQTKIEDTIIGAYGNMLIGVSKQKALKLIELGWT